MTVVLVLVTIIVFLTVDQIVYRRRLAREAQGADVAAERWNVPSNIAIAGNHMWIREGDNPTIGIDEFLGKFLGAVEDIILPVPGTQLSPATANMTVKYGDRSMKLAFPVQGRVVAVNEAVRRNPALAGADPYGEGWLVRIDGAPDAALRRGISASEWLKSQMIAAKEFLAGRSPQVGKVLMQDGGIPVSGVLQQFEQPVWAEFQQKFAVLVTDGHTH